MQIFEELQKLDLPRDQFMVLGSGILAALGIRDAGDIDLLITPDLFDQLRQSGWKYEVIEIEGRPREKISKGIAEAFSDFWWNGGNLKTEDGIAMAEQIDGISFLPLKVLLDVKKAMGREKDLRDIVLIEEYLRAHPKTKYTMQLQPKAFENTKSLRRFNLRN